MRGSIRQKGPNSLQIQVYIDKDSNGKWRRYFETVPGTRKKDAQPRLNEILASLDKGIFVMTASVTVTQHLESWYRGYVKGKTGLRRQEKIRSLIDNRFNPAFGKIQLKNLTWEILNDWYAKLTDENKLTNRTVYVYHQILSQSLNYARRKGYLAANPCDLADPPKPQKIQMRTLIPEELERLLEAAKNSYRYPIIYTAVSTGMRQAELLGLRWRDVDLDQHIISINQELYKRRGVAMFKEPKSQHSRRTIEMTAKLASLLTDHKLDREAWYKRNKNALKPDDLVFAGPQGNPQDPSVLSHEFHKLTLAAGLTGVRFHDLRHTFASLALLRGVNVKVISEVLGHSSVAFTMQTYAHIIKGMQKDAMGLMDSIIPAANYNAQITPIAKI